MIVLYTPFILSLEDLNSVFQVTLQISASAIDNIPSAVEEPRLNACTINLIHY